MGSDKMRFTRDGGEPCKVPTGILRKLLDWPVYTPSMAGRIFWGWWN